MKRRKLQEKLNKMNLDAKLRLYITLMVVLITVLMLLISTIFTVHSLYQKSTEAAYSKLGFAAQSYGDWLDENKNMMMALQMDAEIQKFCTYQAKGKEGYSVTCKHVKENIENQINQNQDINFISVTNGGLNTYVYSGNWSITNTKYEDVYIKGLQESKLGKKSGSTRVNFGNDFFGGSKYSVTFYQPIYSSTRLDEKIGMLCLNVNDSLLEHMDESLTIKSYQTYLADIHGICVSSMNCDTSEERSSVLSFDGRKKGAIYQKGNYYYYQKLNGWNYYVVSVVPAMELYRSSMETAVILLILVAIILAGSIAFVRKLVNKNYGQVAKVVHAMDHISNNDLDYRIRTDDMGPDFEKLAKGFNEMAEDIHELMRTVREEQHQMDQIRFNALQSQIQPHFLYNTLECIHWQSRVEGDKKVSKLIMALASYYRLALSKGKDIIPLSQELEHIKCYLLIQNERYGDMISYEINVDESFNEVKIPKLTLQPLVENSIYHGIRVKEGLRGHISISARRQKEMVIIEVKDSGEGMTGEQIQNMNDSISEYHEQFGYGVRNVNKRIELKFGKTYGLKYEMNQQGGVTVRIALPFQFEEEEASILEGDSDV